MNKWIRALAEFGLFVGVMLLVYFCGTGLFSLLISCAYFTFLLVQEPWRKDNE